MNTFKDILEKINFINMPFKWYVDTSIEFGVSRKIICFHKLSPFREKFLRSIEKQLILNNGNLMVYYQ